MTDNDTLNLDGTTDNETLNLAEAQKDTEPTPAEGEAPASPEAAARASGRQDPLFVAVGVVVCLVGVACVLGCIPSWDSEPSALVGVVKWLQRLFGGGA